LNPTVAEKVNADSDRMPSFTKTPTPVFELYAQKTIPEMVQKQVPQVAAQMQRSLAVDGILQTNSQWL
jgi:hypothetical protein